MASTNLGAKSEDLAPRFDEIERTREWVNEHWAATPRRIQAVKPSSRINIILRSFLPGVLHSFIHSFMDSF